MPEQFKNFAVSTLAAPIDADDTTLIVSQANKFPSVAPFTIRIDQELIRVTDVSGATFTVTRAAESDNGGGPATNHSSGAIVSLNLTAYTVRQLAGAQGAPGGNGSPGAQGATGAASNVAGPQGAQGVTGAQGAAGNQGETGAGIRYRGAFNASNYDYILNDVVLDNGSLFIAIVETVGNPGNTIYENLDTKWRLYVPGIKPFGTYQGNIAYPMGSIINTGDGVNWIALQQVPSGYPPYSYPSYWQELVRNGSQGDLGVQGSQGVQGAQGEAGLTGQQGAQGASIQGAQGDIGAQGAAGQQGSQGADGANGAQGNQGDAGTAGAQGANGNDGAQGMVGTNGPQGDAGSAGAQGSQGAAGNDGAQGSIGPNGMNGNDGAQGSPGDKMAIVPAAGEYVELICVESPEIRFEDVLTVQLKSQNREFLSEIKLDPIYLEVCEPSSIKIISMFADEHVSLAGSIKDNILTISARYADFVLARPESVLTVNVKLSGIRLGRAGRRFARHTQQEAEANNRFWSQWKN